MNLLPSLYATFLLMNKLEEADKLRRVELFARCILLNNESKHGNINYYLIVLEVVSMIVCSCSGAGEYNW